MQELRPPTYYMVLMSFIPVVMFVAGFAALNEGVKNKVFISIMAFSLGVVFIFALIKSFKIITLDYDSIQIRYILFPKKEIIYLKDIKKATATFINSPLIEYWASVLELQTNKGIKRLELRVNYNQKDSTKFFKELNKKLGKRYTVKAV